MQNESSILNALSTRLSKLDNCFNNLTFEHNSCNEPNDAMITEKSFETLQRKNIGNFNQFSDAMNLSDSKLCLMGLVVSASLFLPILFFNLAFLTIAGLCSAAIFFRKGCSRISLLGSTLLLGKNYSPNNTIEIKSLEKNPQRQSIIRRLFSPIVRFVNKITKIVSQIRSMTNLISQTIQKLFLAISGVKSKFVTKLLSPAFGLPRKACALVLRLIGKFLNFVSRRLMKKTFENAAKEDVEFKNSNRIVPKMNLSDSNDKSVIENCSKQITCSYEARDGMEARRMIYKNQITVIDMLLTKWFGIFGIAWVFCSVAKQESMSFDNIGVIIILGLLSGLCVWPMTVLYGRNQVADKIMNIVNKKHVDGK